jgi:hypothetical protein
MAGGTVLPCQTELKPDARGLKKKEEWLPQDVAAIRKRLRDLLDTTAPNGKSIGNSKFGVYAFFDYDGEPIYVGKTRESLRTRIARHPPISGRMQWR